MLLLEKNNQIESLYSAAAIVTNLIFLLFGILFYIILLSGLKTYSVFGC